MAKSAKKRQIRLPVRYNMEYPVNSPGQDYLVRKVPQQLWDDLIDRVELEEVSIRVVIIKMLEFYRDHGFPKNYEPRDLRRTRGPHAR